MTTLEEMVSLAKEEAKEIIEVFGQEHEPILLMDTPDGFAVLRTTASSPILLDLLLKFNAYRYVFIAEAWMTRLLNDSPNLGRLERGELAVSQLPPDDRSEILQIIAQERGNPPTVYTYEIDNTGQGRRLGQEKVFVNEPDQRLGGWMILEDW